MPCRCLLSDSMPDMAAAVREYIDGMDPELRTSPESYQARLDKCRACDFLQDGTCRLCGCYVEARTAKKRQRCPDVPAKWTEE